MGSQSGRGDQEAVDPESQVQKGPHGGRRDQLGQMLLPHLLISRLRLDFWTYSEGSLWTFTRAVLEMGWWQEPSQG